MDILYIIKYSCNIQIYYIICLINFIKVSKTIIITKTNVMF